MEMDDYEAFKNVDLGRIDISNLLNNQNKPRKDLLKISELDEAGNELIDINNNFRKGNLLEKKKKKIINMDKICNSYTFSFIVFFIQSLISLGLFYLYYIFKFRIENTITFIIVETILFFIMLILFTFAFLNIIFDELKIEFFKLGNYTLFIIIIIYQLIFEAILYLLITLDKDQLDFPHFEERAYSKISLCFFFYIYIFYSYFKFDKKICFCNYCIKKCGSSNNYLNILFLIIFSFFDLFISILLINNTQLEFNNRDSSLRNYGIYLLELSFIYSILLLKELIKEKEENKIIWKACEFNFHRSAFFWILLIIFSPMILLYYIYKWVSKYCGILCCCNRIIKNYK